MKRLIALFSMFLVSCSTPADVNTVCTYGQYPPEYPTVYFTDNWQNARTRPGTYEPSVDFLRGISESAQAQAIIQPYMGSGPNEDFVRCAWKVENYAHSDAKDGQVVSPSKVADMWVHCIQYCGEYEVPNYPDPFETGTGFASK